MSWYMMGVAGYLQCGVLVPFISGAFGRPSLRLNG